MSVRPDGTGAVRLASGRPRTWWSPDGAHLAYDSGDDHIQVMNANGSGRRTLTATGILELAWSPNSRQFAVTMARQGGSREVFILDLTGRVVRQLTEEDELPYRLSWSPDGSVIAYSIDRYESGPHTTAPSMELWVVSVAGGSPALLATGVSGAAWSPDGCQIATRSVEGAVMIRWDGSDKRMLLAGSWQTPRWSPNGNRIALESIGGDGITLLEGEGWHSQPIFGGNAYDLQWSPDGTRLAFYGRPNPDAQADFEVWAVGADGTGLINLSHDPADDVAPAW